MICQSQNQSLTQDSGIAINTQPRISPDGKSIAFISDRKGQMNLWVMDSDGKNPKPVFLDTKTEFRWPRRTADGQFIADHSGSRFMLKLGPVESDRV